MSDKKYIIFDLEWTLVESSFWKYELFTWVASTLASLSKDYTLFLSTAASDVRVREYLKQQNLYNYFEYILGSSYIQKSEKHIEYFQEIILDDNFCKKTVFIWDSSSDKYIAHQKDIDFIGIWNHIDADMKINNINELLQILKIWK